MIDTFTGKYSFLSNFYQLDTPIVYHNFSWNNVECVYQAMKYSYNPKVVKMIHTWDNPSKAKRFRGILRDDWEDVKVQIMYELLCQKFQNVILYRKLLETAPHELVEGNYWHDNFWGNCTCDRCQDIEGLNTLGKLLMKIRDSGVVGLAR